MLAYYMSPPSSSLDFVLPFIIESDRNCNKFAHQRGKKQQSKDDDNNLTQHHVYQPINGVYVTKYNSKISIQFDVPGVKVSDLKATYENKILTVQGQRKHNCKSPVLRYRLPIKTLDKATTTATLSQEGVLTIELPSTTNSKDDRQHAFAEPTKVAIQAAELPKENEKNVVLAQLDVPGVRLEDLLVLHYDENRITVKGERKNVVCHNKDTSFTRHFTVGHRTISSLNGYLMNGVLTLTGTFAGPVTLDVVVVATAAPPVEADKHDDDIDDENDTDAVLVETVPE